MILERYPEAVSNLIEELKTLPGIGRRGAERMALALLKKHPDELRNLGGCRLWGHTESDMAEVT